MTGVRGSGGAQVFLLAVLKTAMFWDLVGGDSFPATDIFHLLGRKQDHDVTEKLGIKNLSTPI